MKYASLIITLFFAKMAAAQTCAPASKEMAQYYSQKNWRSVTVGEASISKPVKGYVDDKNNFYFEDLTRSGEFAAQLKIDPSNREFFKYCRDGKAALLRSMRKSGPANKYTVSLKYLPSFSAFANNPLESQKYSEHELTVKLKFEPSSAVLLSEPSYSFPGVQKEIFNLVKSQFKAAPMGEVELDLSGWDDLVCDLAQGNVKIFLQRGAIANAPLVAQKNEVDANDVGTVYRALKTSLANLSKERMLYIAGRTMARLEQDRRTSNLGDKKSFDILKKIMNPEMSRLNELEDSELNCITDQMQTYARSTISIWMNMQIKVPSLSELTPNSERN